MSPLLCTHWWREVVPEVIRKVIGKFKRIIRRKLLSLHIPVTGMVSNPLYGTYHVYGGTSSSFVYEQPVTGIVHNKLKESYIIKRGKDIKKLLEVIMELILE